MSLRIIPLGGLGEVGKNMTVYEHGGETVVVDAGLAFPRDEHLGVDLVLPDISYLEGRRVNAVVLTHGHEDHVGGLPYLLRQVDCDKVIATKLTLGLIKSKLDEHGLSASTELQEAVTNEQIKVGSFTLDFVRMAHSIPDCVAVVLETASRAASSTPATGSSITRRSTGSRRTSAGSQTSGTRASTCSSATRPTQSGPG